MPMSEEARKAHNAYMREYRRKNPEKNRARQKIYNERYWEKKARIMAEQSKEETNGRAEDVREEDNRQ